VKIKLLKEECCFKIKSEWMECNGLFSTLHWSCCLVDECCCRIWLPSDGWFASD